MTIVTQPDGQSLSKTDLDRLFPFNIQFDSHTQDVVDVGPVLARLCPDVKTSPVFTDHFSVFRPRKAAFDLEALCKEKKTVVIRLTRRKLNLRGLFFKWGSGHVVFVGCVEISSSSSLDDYGLKINDFSPADPTPDIIILHQFREMQINDQQDQIQRLESLIYARDKFDRHANTDELTGISNRRRFWNRGSEIIAEADHKQLIVLALLDLDGFKQINDNYGHDVGDVVLQTVATRCSNAFSVKDIVARLGGDEFVVMFHADNKASMVNQLESLIETLAEPINTQYSQLIVRASIGACIVDTDQTIEEGVHRADLAMYEGRKRERGTITWYSSELLEYESYKKSVMARLDAAVTSHEIKPQFQPIIDLSTLTTIGFEALARWHHPHYGEISPEIFIPFAAECGCLNQLDLIILEQSLKQLSSWDKEGRRYGLQVNFSSTSVQVGIEDEVFRLLRQYQVSPNRLTIEISENTLINGSGELLQLLNTLADRGVSIHLDDFGIGYSSITHLHRFPLTGIKIHNSIINQLCDDKSSALLMNNIVSLAAQMGLKVIAEGVEDKDQLESIVKMGCHFIQGNLFAEPRPGDECEHGVFSWQVSSNKAA